MLPCMPSLTPQANDGGLVESMSSGQVVRASTVELTVGRAFAQVQAVIVDDEAVAEGDDLAAEREVDAILAQAPGTEFARTPAQVTLRRI